ncbi:MAG: hypothetical protein NBKEAIPA_01737 [Nitrospirae bacterium]|nr:hypothetical protein [Nitrospirota bacterium]
MPTAKTWSVVKPLCTNTLSMTIWVNSGVSSANNCNTNEAAKTSPKSHRYLTRTGTNHVRSNARPMLSASARFRHSNRVPFQLARYSCLRSTLALGSSGSWIRTVSSDTLASTTYRPSCRPAIAGSGRAARSSHVVAITPAFSPTCLAARTNSWIVRVRSDCPNWWRSCPTSSARSWYRPSSRRQNNPVSVDSS